jgi:hypothetical protein
MAAGRGDEDVEPVKLLGTTWYLRGPGYWVRRIALSFVYLLVAVGGLALTGLVMRAVWDDSTTPMVPKVGLTVIAAVATGWTAAITLRSFRRAEMTGALPTSWVMAGHNEFIRTIRFLGFAAVAVVFSPFIMLGGMTVIFIYSLRFEFFGEHQARLRQEKREAHRGNPPPQQHRRR